MENNEMLKTVNKVFSSIEKLIPSYMEIPEDRNISNGNLAVCIIDKIKMFTVKCLGQIMQG